jgi:small subunit ribosomal protein S6
VGRFNDGIFVLMLIDAGGAVVHEVERRLRVTEPVIKFLTVRTDEELKRLDKIKKIRDSKKKVSAQPAAVAAPVTPVPPVPPVTPVVPEASTETPATAPV